MGKNIAGVPMNGAYEDRVNFLKLMLTESDRYHRLSLHDISICYKRGHYGGMPSRNTLLKIIDEFNSIILKCRMDNNGNSTKEMFYYFNPGETELSQEELAVLLHSINALQCVDGTTKNSIANKLLSNSNKYFVDTYRKTYPSSDTKEKSFCAVDMKNLNIIIEAIKNGKRIQFNYFKYTHDKHKRRSSGETDFEVEPIMLNIDNGFLYLVSNKAGIKDNGRRIYRIDRMDNIRITDPIEGDYSHVCAQEFKSNVFGMFSTGKLQKVQIECEENLASSMVDKFGDFKLVSINGTKFIFEANVETSTTFYAWLTTFGDKIKLVEPQEQVREYKDFLENILSKY